MDFPKDMRQRQIAKMHLLKPDSSSNGIGDDVTKLTSTAGVMAIGLGDRIVVSEGAEVWTVKGVLSDGKIVENPVGELSFVLIPGHAEPATAVVGYIAPRPPYSLAVAEEHLWPQIRGMIAQLGYDMDGYYASIAIGGKVCYRREFNAQPN
ncbi:MAG: hypothetical protein NT027_11595 [Proteobacteria bacterium]|nr:hypothetical protein [Pseudomonadota bacterium]